ncbi:uncharacterized protein ARB_06551 [Trichophyton benhamiae CBS 112371]|uniref:Uncharacterized protein n=1 Tax=Arthroderma benhamiae (strain ATCC MYA-4681 / CBS 112371) TaxID=663331 RepID=D4AQP1_ARTBC|nr:uncharacterized protein ARB_06551 [Trichophyton benhamiae CBS 112371]EFE34785.1 hypothetical protein ARB_06551 [Trichophyton benhamiae CBS 112371]
MAEAVGAEEGEAEEKREKKKRREVEVEVCGRRRKEQAWSFAEAR